ncbi:uncharacterized protein LOC100844168 [Brachypodium distachyon]|uniref:DUF3615 domain-containing protein n=1 Tax=Brachypodium distachyon TaxID=15368 RepID=A0A0Q3GKY3_BRADI|nr:uncharacterized protein LOC100844168 [Brachypodium distachyon]KQK11800.1 hypothetical protein BRADI_2g62496v3 [Brachypodium distachyon]|eukprot:XP_010232887.1 uncharacterized protein LOC100844168 [Brachypodium distachyon]
MGINTNSSSAAPPSPSYFKELNFYRPPEYQTPSVICNWLFKIFRPDPEMVHDLMLKNLLRTREARAQIEGVSHEIVLQCLEWYNSNHPGDEYEPAPGRVTRYTIINNLRWWTHGNFVARRKRSGSGCFSFLPAQRTLFFFELTAGLDCIDQVVTCDPLDEPVTEAYKFLGFRLGCGTRRDGGSDCVCKTCHRQFLLPDPFMTRTCACGGKVERLCHMCYPKCIVLHPLGGEFEFGHHKDNVWKAHLDHA